MVTKEKLTDLYQSQLKPAMAKLEKQRKTIVLIYGIMIALFACTGLLFISMFFLPNVVDNSTVFTRFGLMFGAAILGITLNVGFARSRVEKYRSAYKTQVVEQVIAAIEPTWTYKSDAKVGALEFNSSKLFSRPYSNFGGDDLVTGKIDKTDFQSSELNVYYEVGAGEHKEQKTLFSGFFFHADFNKHFSGETYVVHGDLEDQVKTLRSISSAKTTTTKSGAYVKLENPEFSKIFTVRASNQQEARYLLTPRIMEALVRLHKRYPHPTHISFVGKRVYFAITFGKQLFEPCIFKPVAEFEEVEKLHNLFMLNTEIIQELNLNTRIWTKN